MKTMTTDEAFKDLRDKLRVLTTDRDAFKADAERWQAVKPLFRVMSLDMSGNHTWVLSHHGLLKGPSIDAAIDALMKS